MRNADGEMVPLGALREGRAQRTGRTACRITTAISSAEINGGPAPGYSSGQAEALMAGLAASELPNGMSFEWTDLTYQQILAGNTAVYDLPAVRAARVPRARGAVRELDACRWSSS